jgi:excisionase family DNA binding protein
MNKYYSIEEAAKMLKVAYLTVYRWIQSGKLESDKAGRQYRINKQNLDAFLKHHVNKNK